MKKLGKKVDEFLDSLKKDQSMFTMCCNDDGEFFYAYNAKPDEIGAGIATILSDWFNDKSEASQYAAKGILLGIRAVIMEGGKTSEEVTSFLGKVAAERAMDSLKNLKKILKDLAEDDGKGNEGDGNGSEDDGENCEDCELNRECGLPAAKRYRKANGIPAPKKRSKK